MDQSQNSGSLCGNGIQDKEKPKRSVTNYGTFGFLQVVFHNLVCCVL